MKQFIKESLRKRLIENFNLSPNNAKSLVRLGMESAFDNIDSAKEQLNKAVSGLRSLADPLTLYRVVFVKDPSQINPNEIGSHYVLDKKHLEQTHQNISHVGGGKPMMLTINAPKSLIDYKETLSNRMQYPHEAEITLLNKGKGAKILKVSEFTPSDDLGLGDDFETYDEY